jgi:hypothetical protein
MNAVTALVPINPAIKARGRRSRTHSDSTPHSTSVLIIDATATTNAPSHGDSFPRAYHR